MPVFEKCQFFISVVIYSYRSVSRCAWPITNEYVYLGCVGVSFQNDCLKYNWGVSHNDVQEELKLVISGKTNKHWFYDSNELYSARLLKGSVSSRTPCMCRLLVGFCLSPFSWAMLYAISRPYLGHFDALKQGRISRITFEFCIIQSDNRISITIV